MVLPWIVEVRFAGGQWLTVATGLVASQVFLSFPIPHPGFSFGAPLAGGSMRIRNTDAAQTVAAFYAIHEAAGVSG